MNNINDPNLPGRECVVEYPNRIFNNKVCWSAIFSGAFVGVGLGFILHLYTSAIGLSAYSSSPEGASVIAIGGCLGLLIATVAAMTTAGFVSGYLGRYHYHHVSGGIIYGFITWTLALIISVMLSGAMMHYVNMYSNNVTHASVNDATPKVKVTTDESANDEAVPVPTHKNRTDATAKKITPTDLAVGGWIIFLLFFIGALSTCVGAICGMKCHKEESVHHHHHSL